MCIAISLPKELKDAKEAVELQVIECATFLSENRRALIAFDVFVLNRAERDIHLLCTHVDTPDVAQLATDDFFDAAEQKDDRARLVEQVYGESWNVNASEAIVRFVDPIEKRFNPDESKEIRARALTNQPDARFDGSLPFRQIAQSCLSSPDGTVPVDRPGARPAYYLRDVSVESLGRGRQTTERPYSTFRIGPFPTVGELKGNGNEPLWTFFRLSIELRSEVYERLIGATPDTPFEMMSSQRVIRYLQSRLSRPSPREVSADTWQGMGRFFEENVSKTEVIPRPYQIILGQPKPGELNRYIQVRPTSSRISERYIPNDEARLRAMWFHSEGPDFSLVLKYGEMASNARPNLFREPLPSHICVPFEKSSTSAL